jgi:hypothetical protein
VYVRDLRHILHAFTFYANIGTFLKSTFPYPSQTPVPWKTWGPQNTRWFQEIYGVAWANASYGYRAVDAVPSDESDFDEASERKLRVRDFNPSVVRRCAYGQVEKGWMCRAVTTPSTTFTNGAYEEDVISSLAYTEVISEETFYTGNVMMDDSRLLLPRVSEPFGSFSGSNY